MRLSTDEQERIRRLVAEGLPAGVGCDLRVFGSCVDEHAKGGDVDIYLEVAGLSPQRRMELAYRLRPELEEALDRPVDLVTQDAERALKQVSRFAREEGEPIGPTRGP